MAASDTAFGVALAVGVGIGQFVYTPILPFMTTELGLTPTEGGLVASANFLGHLLGALAVVRARMPGGRRAHVSVAYLSRPDRNLSSARRCRQ